VDKTRFAVLAPSGRELVIYYILVYHLRWAHRRRCVCSSFPRMAADTSFLHSIRNSPLTQPGTSFSGLAPVLRLMRCLPHRPDFVFRRIKPLLSSLGRIEIFHSLVVAPGDTSDSGLPRTCPSGRLSDCSRSACTLGRRWPDGWCLHAGTT